MAGTCCIGLATSGLVPLNFVLNRSHAHVWSCKKETILVELIWTRIFLRIFAVDGESNAADAMESIGQEGGTCYGSK